MTCFFCKIASVLLAYALSGGAASGAEEPQVIVDSNLGGEVVALNLPEGRINQGELRGLLDELNGLLAGLDEQDHRLSSRIDALATQAATERAQLRRAVEGLNDDAAALNQAIASVSAELETAMEEFETAAERLEQANRSSRDEFRQSTEALGGELDRIDQAVFSLDVARQGFAGRLTQFESLLEQRALQVDQQVLAVADSVDGVRDSVEDRYGSMQTDVFQRSLIGLAALIALTIVIVLVAKQLGSRQRSVAGELKESLNRTQEEQNRLDLKLSELLESQLNEAPAGSVEDNDFFINLADEINRMRKRFARMPADTKGIKPLGKALERLERGMEERGYEIVDMLNKPYAEGMNVKPRFVSDDSLPLGEQKITNIIKPQVSFNGKVVQVAEIEVSVG